MDEDIENFSQSANDKEVDCQKLLHLIDLVKTDAALEAINFQDELRKLNVEIVKHKYSIGEKESNINSLNRRMDTIKVCVMGRILSQRPNPDF